MDEIQRVLGQFIRIAIHHLEKGRSSATAEGDHCAPFAQRSGLAENVHQLLPVGHQTDLKFDHCQDARIQRHDVHLVGDQLSAAMVGSGSSDKAASVKTAHPAGSIRNHHWWLGNDGRGERAFVCNG